MILVDTGAFVGRFLARDQHHAASVRGWRKVGGDGATTSLVLAETFTLLGRWAGYGFAAGHARSILAATSIKILRPDEADELAAVDWFEKYADKKVSFVDCVSFALMRRHGIERAFTFDRHFRDAGFKLWPPG